MNLNSLVTTMNPEITRRIAVALVHSTWQGAAGAVLLAGILRATRNRSASARYIVSCAALVAVFASAAVTFVMTGRRATLPSNTSGAFLGDVPRMVSEGAAAVVRDAAPAHWSIGHLAVGMWIVGVALLSMWQIAGWAWLHVIRRRGTPVRMEELERLVRRMNMRQSVRVIEAPGVQSPAVMGVWRPAILVPLGFMSGLAPTQVEAILAHELAHIRRWDYLANLVQLLVETLLFYHPCVWWISSQIRQEREHCCDDIAANVLGDRVAYAEMLVMLEGRRTPKLALAAGGGSLSRRVRRLIGAPLPRKPRRRSALAGIVAAACIVALVLSRVAPAQTEKIVKAVAAATTNVSNSILPEDLVAEPHDYQIGGNDLVAVSINDLVGPGVETVKSVRVGEKSGEISLPLVGNVHVAGLTAPQAERAIAKAYEDGQLLKQAQASVSIIEQRGNTFSIFGSTGRSGEFAIAKADFRVLDALVLGGISLSPQLDSITILRKQEQGARRRIDIPIAPLTAGDLRNNVVIRPGDLIMATEPEKRFVKVIVDRDALFMRESDHGRTWDQKVDWSYVEDHIRAMTPAQRHALVLEIGVANRDLSVGTLMDAQAAARDLVAKYSLSYLSDVGVQTLKVSDSAPGAGVYYIGGHVKRVGVYQLTPQTPITVKQAIIAAGGQEEGGKFVHVLRRNGGNERDVLDAELDPQLSDPKLGMTLEPNDLMQVQEKPWKTK
jgi:beta-lactamase regulating signal transducer with metallopeptidase domain/protein involved in polysaccharide export with SLBB domain